jgi:hypothetical protein
MSGELSYVEVLVGVVSEDEIEGLVGLISAHKNWGAFRVQNLHSHTVVLLIDEIKRLREAAGKYKSVPSLPEEKSEFTAPEPRCPMDCDDASFDPEDDNDDVSFDPDDDDTDEGLVSTTP